MAKKIRLKKTDTVGLKMSADEREMVLDLPLLNDGLEERLEQTPIGEAQVKFTLDELDLLAGKLAANANHMKGRRLGMKLDAIWMSNAWSSS